MERIKTVEEVAKRLQVFKEKNKRIGLVPTMGALHKGHLELVKRSVRENDVTVVSIFVNPTQFNDRSDLENYPRSEEEDCKLLEAVGCTIAFLPSTQEMYPEPDERVFNLGPVANVMEGAFRKGHFNGVAQIVSKLFYIVRPDNAYFGEKDFQQIAVIRQLVKILSLKVNIVACPIVRESSGLALSSRNKRLNEEEKKTAVNLSKILFESKRRMNDFSIKEMKDWVTACIKEFPLLKPDYYEIVDGDSLKSISDWSESKYIVGCIAVYCGKIRLIDNICYKKEE